MKAIQTKYLPQTNSRGSRIKASDLDGLSVTINYPHEVSRDDAHAQAALALCAKMGWKGTLQGGDVRKEGRVFCFLDTTDQYVAA